MSSNIEYHKFSKGETCSTTGCRSKHYYIQDGKRVCKAHGHVQEGFTQVQQDEDDFNTQGRKSRRKREEEKAVNRTYEGKAAVTLYVQCWQLILRKQVRWMVVEKHLPEELEKVVRDLWALRIRAVKGLGEEFEGDGASTGFSSTSEGETEVEDGVGIEMRRRLKKLARAKGLPKLIETLAMCYSAVLLMRLPVTVGDMFAWVGQPGFPYLRAAKEIPQDMKSHLPGKYLSALETRGRLKLGRLQKAVMDLIFQLKMNFEVALPPMNVSLVLFHQVKKLCLPRKPYSTY
jgi:RNA polymerase I-specific transcription initiation factor RRN7